MILCAVFPPQARFHLSGHASQQYRHQLSVTIFLMTINRVECLFEATGANRA